MVIRELYVKNFGKLSEKHFYFRDGVQVISGENEFGKTTLHAFVKAMLFGLERGRGRAAAKDDFTKYEPRSGGRYAGVMRFDCGGRHFRLERTFGTGVKNSKSAALICEDDGEELSVEHGDLEMLLGGLTAELFDSTVSVGQLKSRPGEALSDALENYAANYYETGGTELDLSGAVQILREKRKKTDRFIREEADKEERKIQKMLQECEYLEQDMDEIQREYEERRTSIVDEISNKDFNEDYLKDRFFISFQVKNDVKVDLSGIDFFVAKDSKNKSLEIPLTSGTVHSILFNGEGDGSYSFITKEGKNYIVIQLNELKSDMEITIQ